MKKSFILHYDSLSVIDKMTDEQTGKLFRMMKSYHNGRDYICEDLAVELVFEQFKNQFDRDLIKYNNICERNSNNGKKWWRPQEPKKPTGLSGNPKKPKKADNDSDNKNDSDNVNENNIQSEQEVKEKIKEIYTEQIVNNNITKYRLLLLFIMKWYTIKIDKKSFDKFFADMIDKSHRYGYSWEWFADRDTLLLKAKEMYERAEWWREMKNHMSTLNKFLSPNPKK